MRIITWPHGTPTPHGAQPDWAVTSDLDLGLPGRRQVGRIPDDASIPDGAEPYSPPAVTPALERIAESRSLQAQIAQLVLDQGDFDQEVERYLGLIHPYAVHAPWSVETLDEACHAHAQAQQRWCSPCSCAVIRTAERGYQVWRGIGSMMESAGVVRTYEGAERLAIDHVHAARQEAIAGIRTDLAGWSDETPYYSATLATIDRLPIVIRRGPMTAAEAPDARVLDGSAGPLVVGGTSWDLPVVAEVRGGSVERWPERVTWDDEESRARSRERNKRGHAAHAAEEWQACRMLTRYPALKGIVRKRSLASVTLTTRDGGTVQTLGPVRMREDGACPLALVRYGSHRHRMWMAIGEFVA